MKLGLLGLFAGLLVLVLIGSIGGLIYVLNSDDTSSVKNVVVQNATTNTQPVDSTNQTSTASTAKKNQSGPLSSTNIESAVSSFETITDQETLIANQDEGETSIGAQTQAVTDASNAYE